MKKLGEQEYDSSEHFVTWARYGVCFSSQARSRSRSNPTHALAGVVLGAIAVGVAGLVVSGVFSWLKGDASDDDHAAPRSSSGDHGDRSSASRQERHVRYPGGRDSVCTTHSPQSEEYVEERHSVLVTRLAEDELQCGICFTNLLDVRAMAFLCDHFTCGTCYLNLSENSEGHKRCPYCRLEFRTVDEIHESIKMRANSVLRGETRQEIV